MHVAVGIALALLALLLMVGVAGATPFIGIPLAAVLLILPFAWVALTARRARERSLEKSGVPTTEQATYDPAVDPGDRP